MSHHRFKNDDKVYLLLREKTNYLFRFLQLPDAMEGFRCVVVDKGAAPKWTYKSIYEVPQEEVEKMFAPLETDKIFLQNCKL